jgi:hypothetical protein
VLEQAEVAMKSDSIVAAAERISGAAAEQGTSIKALGGVGCWLRVRDHIGAARFRRDYGDLDIVVSRGGGARVVELLSSLGYVPAASFNAVHGETRLMFADPDTGSRIDVFLGGFAMCHTVPLPGEAFAGPSAALAVPELVLMKLQVVEANQKDLRDVAALFAFDDFATVEGDRLVKALSKDWGLWRTVSANLERMSVLDTGDSDIDARVHAMAREVLAAAEAAPKSMKWKARAVVGERTPWYDTPEEPETEAVAVR